MLDDFENDPVKRSEKLLNYLSENFDEFVFDTCALMHEGSIPLLKNLSAHLNGRKIIIPSAVINELQKISEVTDEIKSEKASNALNCIEKLEDDGIVGYTGTNTVDFADPEILMYVLNQRTRKRLVVITQDEDLSRDILENINEVKSVSGNHHRVYRVNKYGYLSKPYCMFFERDEQCEMPSIENTEDVTEYKFFSKSNLLKFAVGMGFAVAPVLSSLLFLKNKKL